MNFFETDLEYNWFMIMPNRFSNITDKFSYYWEEEIHRFRKGVGEKKKYANLNCAKIVALYNDELGAFDYLMTITTCIINYFNLIRRLLCIVI